MPPARRSIYDIDKNYEKTEPYMPKRSHLTYEHKRILANSAHRKLLAQAVAPSNRNAYLAELMTPICEQNGWPSPVHAKTAGRIYDSFISGTLNQGLSQGAKRVSTQKFADVEDALYIWIMSYNPFTDISSNMIHRKALEIYERLHPGKDDFRASPTFIKNFTTRRCIELKEGQGETGFDDRNLSDKPVLYIQNEVKGYPLSRIYNMDECALFYNESHSRSYTLDKESAKRKAKERLTVTVCVNADGSDKLRCWVLGKSDSPRCFKNLGDDWSEYAGYKSNAKGRMRSDLFWEYIQWFRGQIGGNPAVLIVDNCSAHASLKGTDAELRVQTIGNLKILYLPKNEKSVPQPCDQGVIKSLKSKYRQYMCQRKMIAVQALEKKHGDIQSVPENEMYQLSRFNVRDACVVLSQAWQDVDPLAVRTCWKKWQLMVHYGNIKESDGIIDEPVRPLRELKKEVEYFRSRKLMHIATLLNVSDTIDADNTTREDYLQLPEDEKEALEVVMNSYWSNNREKYLDSFGEPYPSSDPEPEVEPEVPSYRNIRASLCELQLELMDAGIATTSACDSTLSELKASLDVYANKFESTLSSDRNY